MGNQHLPGVFNFSDRNGVLLEWNDDIDKYNENIVEKNAILYPSLAVEFPGITLGRNVAVPSIEDDIFPHGLAKDAAAQNANAAPFVAQEGINGPAAIQANDNKIDEGKYDDKDDGIIKVADIPPGNAPLQNPIVAIPDSDEDAASTSKDLDSDDNEDKDPDFQDAHDQEDEGKKNEEEQEDDNVPGLRRSKRRNRGQTTRYANYGLMMAARWTRGGQLRAIIHNGFCCFLAEDLHDAKPMPEEDRKEYALGVAMAQYLIGAGIKKFKERGEAGVSKELTQMHDMQVF
jgi:hypothetical protein